MTYQEYLDLWQESNHGSNQPLTIEEFEEQEREVR